MTARILYHIVEFLLFVTDQIDYHLNELAVWLAFKMVK